MFVPLCGFDHEIVYSDYIKSHILFMWYENDYYPWTHIYKLYICSAFLMTIYSFTIDYDSSGGLLIIHKSNLFEMNKGKYVKLVFANLEINDKTWIF